MGKVRINKSLCKQAPAQAARTWVEADDYETVEAEAEAVYFKKP